MKFIKRPKYLNKLISLRGTPDIKVITGIRRSGKSRLLLDYITYLKENDSSANIVFIDFSSLNFSDICEYHKLNNYIEEKFIAGKNNYIFIDEVQLCPNFEYTVNSLHNSGKYDIYITGSNAFLLSSDLATLFTGRTFPIEVFPFSLAEYRQYHKYTDPDTAFDNYVNDGGMAGAYNYQEQEDKYKYIREVFDTLLLRDIYEKYKLRNTLLLEKLVDFLSDNIGNLTSIRKISDSFSTNNKSVSHITVRNYIDYLTKAFAFYKIRRYDIQGKKYLSTIDKYYLSDHSFKYAKLGTKNMNYGRIYENIVAIELLRRGYEIYVGTLYKKEVDFIAIKRNEKIYIQVCDNLEDEKTLHREVEPLLKIKDAYPKFILARTHHEEYQYEGIKIINLAHWLLQE